MEELTSLQQGYYHLQRGHFSDAREAFRAVIANEDGHKAEAYIGILLSENNLRDEEQLPELPQELSGFELFAKAKEHASGGYLKTLEGYEQKQNELFERKESGYLELVKRAEAENKSEEELEYLLGRATELRKYKDAAVYRDKLKSELEARREHKEKKNRRHLYWIVPVAALLVAAFVAFAFLFMFPKRNGVSYVLTLNGYSVSGVDDRLTEVVVPSTVNGIPVTAISQNALKDRDRLRSLEFRGRYEVFEKEGIVYRRGETGLTVFAAEEDLTEVVIPASVDGAPVTAIGREAFKDHEDLRSIDLGGNVAVIGEKAFSGCEALLTVTGGERVNRVQKKAFNKCVSLKELHFAEDLYSARTAYSDCRKLEVFAGGKSVDFDPNAD